MTATAESADAARDLPDAAPDDARLMSHAYDGIREYDNPLPGWWSAIFIGTIVFAGAYGVYYHITKWGKMPDENYRAALADYDSKKEARDRAEAANISEQTIATAAQDGSVVERGSALFTQRCASCHADKGQGLIGPNLTDLHQMHGSTRMDLYTTISKGVPSTAMLAWGEQLPQTDVLAVTAFVSTLRGKNLAGKEPQGPAVEKF